MHEDPLRYAFTPKPGVMAGLLVEQQREESRWGIWRRIRLRRPNIAHDVVCLISADLRELVIVVIVVGGVIGGIDGSLDRPGELRRLFGLNSLQDDFMALDDVIELEVPNCCMASQLSCKPCPQVSRPAGAGATRKREAHTNSYPT